MKVWQNWQNGCIGLSKGTKDTIAVCLCLMPIAQSVAPMLIAILLKPCVACCQLPCCLSPCRAIAHGSNAVLAIFTVPYCVAYCLLSVAHRFSVSCLECVAGYCVCSLEGGRSRDIKRIIMFHHILFFFRLWPYSVWPNDLPITLLPLLR